MELPRSFGTCSICTAVRAIGRGKKQWEIGIHPLFVVTGKTGSEKLAEIGQGVVLRWRCIVYATGGVFEETSKGWLQ